MTIQKLSSAAFALGLLALMPTNRACSQPASTAGAASAPASSAIGANVKTTGPTYAQDVLPVLMGKCARCHNDQSQLPNWLDYKTAFHDRREMKRRVWDSWKGDYYKQPMPAGNGQECLSMTEEERALIKEWVATGAAYGVTPGQGSPISKPEQIQRGRQLFAVICTPCHQATGMGVPDKFPPLAGSDFLNADKNRAVKVLLHGRQGDIVVNGHKFNNTMPVLPLSDADIANALTFVYNSFGNSGKQVTAEEVKTLRAQKEEPAAPREVAHAEPPSSLE